ncbi:skin secretory protein xP2-like [Canis lupus dingo]|uniref:skin secretory protein xP2-like n=1 Tax=Canis lupus dingo TaxID=286419 RepID=UPI0020C54C35|nr:skin secretory protein xP2-like [Canis lupus dingo]
MVSGAPCSGAPRRRRCSGLPGARCSATRPEWPARLPPRSAPAPAPRAGQEPGPFLPGPAARAELPKIPQLLAEGRSGSAALKQFEQLEPTRLPTRPGRRYRAAPPSRAAAEPCPALSPREPESGASPAAGLKVGPGPCAARAALSPSAPPPRPARGRASGTRTGRSGRAARGARARGDPERPPRAPTRCPPARPGSPRASGEAPLGGTVVSTAQQEISAPAPTPARSVADPALDFRNENKDDPGYKIVCVVWTRLAETMCPGKEMESCSPK